MKYLERTKNFVPILRANDMMLLRWYVDTAYAVHSDFKGHMGGLSKLGKSRLCNSLRKQHLNTRSTTETELIGVHDVLSEML